MSTSEKPQDRVNSKIQGHGLDLSFDLGDIFRTEHDSKSGSVKFFLCGTHVASMTRTDKDKDSYTAAHSRLAVKNASGTRVMTKGYASENPATYDKCSNNLMVALGRQLFNAAERVHEQDKSSRVADKELRQYAGRLEAITAALDFLYDDDVTEGTITAFQWSVLDDKYKKRFLDNKPWAIPTEDAEEDEDSADESDPEEDEEEDAEEEEAEEESPRRRRR